jgi:hypothetical protein
MVTEALRRDGPDIGEVSARIRQQKLKREKDPQSKSDATQVE